MECVPQPQEPSPSQAPGNERALDGSDEIPPPMPKLTPERIAHHEAGHAVANVVLCCPPFKYVSLRARDMKSIGSPRALGAVHRPFSMTARYLHANAVDFVRDDGFFWREMLMVLAGPEAETMFTGHPPGHMDAITEIGDFRVAFEMFQKKWGVAAVDAPLPLRKCLLEKWHELTMMLRSETIWPMVRAVAQALLEKKRLSYEQVVSVMEANGWRILNQPPRKKRGKPQT